jgi:undecaprenyl-diphosphatase
MTRTAGMLNFITQGDHRLMHHLNQWRAPRWIRAWMILATRAGDGWLWFAMGAIILLFGGEERFHAAGAAALAAFCGTALFMLLKKRAARTRPCAIEPHCWAKLLPPDQFSFPSGHSITAFAVAVPLSLYYPPLTIGLLFCACSVAASRIMLGLHFLSDVIAGCAIGTVLGCGAYLLL